MKLAELFEKNEREILELLQKSTLDLNQVDEDGKGLLHWAAIKGYASLASTLIDGGKPVDCAVDSESASTPLHYAAMTGHSEVVQILLDKGAKVDATCRTHGATALHYASYHRHLEVAKLLLAQGANIEATDKNGGTPLHPAAFAGHLEIVKLLLEKSAYIGAVNNDGQTPIDLAQKRGHTQVAELLQKFIDMNNDINEQIWQADNVWVKNANNRNRARNVTIGGVIFTTVCAILLPWWAVGTLAAGGAWYHYKSAARESLERIFSLNNSSDQRLQELLSDKSQAPSTDHGPSGETSPSGSPQPSQRASATSPAVA
jgi:ankyrin repeat protein